MPQVCAVPQRHWSIGAGSWRLQSAGAWCAASHQRCECRLRSCAVDVLWRCSSNAVLDVACLSTVCLFSRSILRYVQRPPFWLFVITSCWCLLVSSPGNQRRQHGSPKRAVGARAGRSSCYCLELSNIVASMTIPVIAARCSGSLCRALPNADAVVSLFARHCHCALLVSKTVHVLSRCLAVPHLQARTP